MSVCVYLLMVNNIFTCVSVLKCVLQFSNPIGRAESTKLKKWMTVHDSRSFNNHN